MTAAHNRCTMTPEELEAAFNAVPPEQVAEIIDGELVVSPRPAAPHANAASDLTEPLRGPFHRGHGGPGGWVILAEPELHSVLECCPDNRS